MLARLLRTLGRHARAMLPLGVCLGLVFPGLADALQSLVTPTVVGMITASLLRLDWSRQMMHLRQPGLPLRIAFWQLLVSPIAIWLLALAGAIPDDLVVLSVLQAASAPIGSSAAFAMFLGMPGHLCMAGTVIMTLLLPVTLTATVALLLPSFGVSVDLVTFALRVTLTALAPFVVTAVIRQLTGDARLRARDEELAGVNVLLLVLFAIAIMHGVTATFLIRPGFITALFVWACLSAALWHAVGLLLWLRSSHDVSLSAALMLGNRNLGLTLVVTAGTAGEAFQMYAGLAQIPLFCAPLLLSPLARRLSSR
jgi:BASS family bile acid:Na+ symporter